MFHEFNNDDKYNNNNQAGVVNKENAIQVLDRDKFRTFGVATISTFVSLW